MRCIRSADEWDNAASCQSDTCVALCDHGSHAQDRHIFEPTWLCLEALLTHLLQRTFPLHVNWFLKNHWFQSPYVDRSCDVSKNCKSTSAWAIPMRKYPGRDFELSDTHLSQTANGGCWRYQPHQEIYQLISSRMLETLDVVFHFAVPSRQFKTKVVGSRAHHEYDPW